MMSEISERELAWDLVDDNRDNLSHAERIMAYVHLGVGDNFRALVYVLEVLVQKQIRVITEVAGRLAEWADAYDIDRAARRLLELTVGDGAIKRRPL